MRRLILILYLLLIGLTALPAAAQSGKILFINMEKALEGYHRHESNKAGLQEKAAKFGAEKKALVDEYTSLDDDYKAAREEARDPTYSRERQDLALERAERALISKQGLEGKIRKLEVDRNRQFEEELRRVRGNLMRDVSEAVRNYAQENAVAAIFDTSAVSILGGPMIPYADSTVDITDAIIERLNRDR